MFRLAGQEEAKAPAVFHPFSSVWFDVESRILLWFGFGLNDRQLVPWPIGPGGGASTQTALSQDAITRCIQGFAGGSVERNKLRLDKKGFDTKGCIRLKPAQIALGKYRNKGQFT
jgi:hypothetical protein